MDNKHKLFYSRTGREKNTSFVTKFRDHITNNIDNFTHVGGNIVVRDSKIRNNRKD